MICFSYGIIICNKRLTIVIRRNRGMIMKKIILTILLFGTVVLGLTTGCDSKKDAEKNMQETVDKYGSVEKETVETLVAKFNTEIMNNNGNLNPASDEYLTTENNQYWYGLVEGIYLVVTPIEFSDDKTKDIVDGMTIYVQKGSKYENDVINYVKYLVNANSEEITADEINSLIDDAKQKVNKEKANNGKGISLGYNDNTDNYQYLVKRLNK